MSDGHGKREDSRRPALAQSADRAGDPRPAPHGPNVNFPFHERPFRGRSQPHHLVERRRVGRRVVELPAEVERFIRGISGVRFLFLTARPRSAKRSAVFNARPSPPGIAGRLALIFQGLRRGALADMLVALILARIMALFAQLEELIGQIRSGQ
jgi:hypothetical protein